MGQENTDRVVQAGKEFTIDLEAMPGAGYMWELAPHPGEIELLHEEVVSISKAIGGSSTQRFTLVAHQPGKYTLSFALKRRWEQSPAKTTEISIHVK